MGKKPTKNELSKAAELLATKTTPKKKKSKAGSTLGKG